MIVQVYKCLRNRAATTARVMLWVVPWVQGKGKGKGQGPFPLQGQGMADLRSYCL